MEADFAVELGADDETLDLPWAGPEGGPRYYDLKRHPELLYELEEARAVMELSEFLAFINRPSGIFETAKCDTWSSTDINPEEEMFGSSQKFGSYVDLLFSDTASQASFAQHEALVKEFVHVLKPAPPILASAEFLIRRCYYHDAAEAREGFYVTLYLFGYGNDEIDARTNWTFAIKLAENAVRHVERPG